MEFWLERGVDGFRVDTVNMYSKGEMMDAPITDPQSEWQFAGYQYCNGPRMAEFLSEMNAILEKYDAMTVGECPNTPDMKRVLQYVSAREKQLNMVFQFVSLFYLPSVVTSPDLNRTLSTSDKALTNFKPHHGIGSSPSSSAPLPERRISSARPATAGPPYSSKTTTNHVVSLASHPTYRNTASLAERCLR
tara:strand:- start:8482 stop:9054 length:573 start_codon:yes stop_codon:yes gene_type:complete